MNLLRSYSQFYRHSLLRTKLIGTFFSKSISCSSCPRHRGKMGLFEILVKRELTLECLQLPSINPLLNNACMPTLKGKLNEVLKVSCMCDNMDISKMGPILPRLPLVNKFIHSFILNIYIALLQENYSEAFPTPVGQTKQS